jgi:5-(carboxyamino)imidazole ribonucleotide synthase
VSGARSVGVLGAGQLGRMLALAGAPLHESFVFLHPHPSASVRGLGDQLVAPYEDRARLEELVRRARVVTYEFESVPAEPVRWLAERVPTYPPPRALEVSQDRFLEKTFFEELGLPTAPFAAVDDEASLAVALAHTGASAHLKTRRGGYDGKGQARIARAEDAVSAWRTLGGHGGFLLERHVDFSRELSVIAVRARSGETRTYPLVENRHAGGILRTSLFPAPHVHASLQERARGYAEAVLSALEYVGVLAIELFEAGDDLVVNEMAPRVHNSGHATIEGAETSQFENHLRAILGLPLGGTAAIGVSGMLNLIGGVPPREAVLKVAPAHLHLYGKDPKPGRKVGHVTVHAEGRAEVDRALAALAPLVAASSA